jgi:hypothetical protein
LINKSGPALAAFGVIAVYNRDKHQVTIHATVTGATPRPS